MYRSTFLFEPFIDQVSLIYIYIFFLCLGHIQCEKSKSIDLDRYILSIIPNVLLRSDRMSPILYTFDLFYTKLLFSVFFFRVHLNTKFKLFIDLMTCDLLVTPFRFFSTYNFLSFLSGNNAFLRVLLPQSQLVDSIAALFKNAGWYERESYDLFGICFFGNFDLRRILTDYGFQYFPLRKDFPIIGFIELSYEPSQKTILYRKLYLVQEFRIFLVRSIWYY